MFDLFPVSSLNILITLAESGYLIFMFMIGVKMDASLLMGAGKREWSIAAATFIVPGCVVTQMANTLSIRMDHIPPRYSTWVIVVAGSLMITSFPVVACFLLHLKMTNSELGHLALSSALIADLMSVVMNNLQAWSNLMQVAQPHTALKSIFLGLFLIAFILFALRPFMFWMVRRTPEGKPVRDSFAYLVFLILLVVAITGDNIGLQFLYGPFILGLAVPNGPPLASVIVEKLDALISGLILPLMTTLCAFRVDPWIITRMPPAYFFLVGIFGFPIKIGLSFLTALWFKVPCKDSAALSLILTTKGVVELSVIGISSDKMLAPHDQYAVSALMVFFISVVVPPLVKMLHDPSITYAGYQKRTIQNSNFSDGLRVLACAQRQDDALAAVKLLEIASPTKESPLTVFGLYLEELRGGSTPVLLNHQLGQKRIVTEGTRWQPIVAVFNYFKTQHKKQVNVQVFTAISHAKLMHEDICWVSFSNAAVLIVLPFHRKWNVKGIMIADCKSLRTLNNEVLKMAPCSVGILVDRSRSRYTSIFESSPSYRISMIYIGGNDDREALALARRMANSLSVNLTIFRLVSVTSNPQQDWEVILDNEALKEFKHEYLKNDNVTYKEVPSEDGTQTASFIKSIVEGDGYDLILAGRRHDNDSRILMGLHEWSEVPELGVIGDLLASPDTSSFASVLVVQQQIIPG